MNKENTPWTRSSKGNWWRWAHGKHLVIGQSKTGPWFWVLCDGIFLTEKFDTEKRAKCAAEASALVSLLN